MSRRNWYCDQDYLRDHLVLSQYQASHHSTLSYKYSIGTKIVYPSLLYGNVSWQGHVGRCLRPASLTTITSCNSWLGYKLLAQLCCQSTRKIPENFTICSSEMIGAGFTYHCFKGTFNGIRQRAIAAQTHGTVAYGTSNILAQNRTVTEAQGCFHSSNQQIR